MFSNALELLTVVFDESYLRNRNVYNWLKLFAEDQVDVEDDACIGRHCTSKIDENIEAV